METTLNIKTQQGQSLSDALVAQGICVETPCGGRGSCGKCLVKVVDGNSGSVTADEQLALGHKMISTGYRLACLTHPENEITIFKPQAADDHRILADGRLPEFTANPSVQKFLLNIRGREIDDNRPVEEWLKSLTNLDVHDLDLDDLKELATSKLGYGKAKKTFTLALNQQHFLALEEGNTTTKIYGLAFDIGTTTIICSLVNLKTGRELDHASMINPQTKQGLDVLSRIAFVQEQGQEGLDLLKNAVLGAMEDLGLELCCKLSLFQILCKFHIHFMMEIYTYDKRYTTISSRAS